MKILNFNLQVVGQGHRVQFSQLRHSMTNVKNLQLSATDY